MSKLKEMYVSKVLGTISTSLLTGIDSTGATSSKICSLKLCFDEGAGGLRLVQSPP